MVKKRGRPISSGASSSAEQRQRELWRRQQVAHRERVRSSQNIPTSQGALYGEQLIDFSQTPIEEESAEPTILQLGLRVQGLTLAQDQNLVNLQDSSYDQSDDRLHHEDVEEQQYQQQQNLHHPHRQSTTHNQLQHTSQLAQSPQWLHAQEKNRPQHQQHQQPQQPQQPQREARIGFFKQFAHKAHDGSRDVAERSQAPTPGPPAYQNAGTPMSQGARTPSLPKGQSSLSQHFLVVPSPRPINTSPLEDGSRQSSERAITPVPPSNVDHSASSSQIHRGRDSHEGRSRSRSADSQVPPTNQHAQFAIPYAHGGGSEDLLGLELLRQDGQGGDSEPESEPVSFASERSVHSSTSSETGELTPVQFVANKLYEQLQRGHHGCTSEEHEGHRIRHMNEAGDNHHSLAEVFNSPRFPSVLGQLELLTTDRLARQYRPSPAEWQDMFCGTGGRGEGEQGQYMNVCLHKEETGEVKARVTYDVDSILGFANSLRFARKGIRYQPSPQMRQNMKTDVHIQTTGYDGDGDGEGPGRPRAALLRDVPHFLLGHVEGTHDMSLFLLFPHITVTGDKFQSLTQEQLARWTDRVWMPALHRYYRADYMQHLPATYRSAVNNSRAHQVENRQVETASYQAKQSIGYHLQPDVLEEIWADVLRRVSEEPGLGDFRDPELFFTAKGTKLQFKTSNSRTSLLGTMQFFQSYLDGVVDLEFVQRDRLFVDIGKEICAVVSLARSEQLGLGDEAQVYLWKHCCQEKYMGWMYDGQPPAKGGKGQLYFTQNMLRDTGSMTSVPPKHSKHWEGGLAYSQFYNSVKGIYDVTKCFPFTNDAMEELALDPNVRNAARNIAGGNRRDAKVVEAGFIASKRRTNDALRDSQNKSFGIREEHRIRWDLFLELERRLRVDLLSEASWELEDCPPYVFAVRTNTYLDFLWRSADKFATGFEVVRASSRRDMVTWEQTKMMAAFLRCLRFVFGGHLLSKESALWWGKRERRASTPENPKVYYGLGFRNTVASSGYCWLEPRIDWNRLQFKSEYTDDMLFGNSILRGQYLRRGSQVQAFFDTTRRLELALEWLERHRRVERVADRLVSWIVHICLQQFRIDVIRAVNLEIVEAEREEASKGLEGFSHDYIEGITARGCYVVSGNKTDFKHPKQLINFLFNWGDGKQRDHWEDRAYRALYRRAKTAVALIGKEFEDVLDRRFLRWIFTYHWVLPYPTMNSFMQTSKQHLRMWYSINIGRESAGQGGEEIAWVWARKDWRPGRPEAIPDYVAWEKEQWERWIETRVPRD